MADILRQIMHREQTRPIKCECCDARVPNGLRGELGWRYYEVAYNIEALLCPHCWPAVNSSNTSLENLRKTPTHGLLASWNRHKVQTDIEYLEALGLIDMSDYTQ